MVFVPGGEFLRGRSHALPDDGLKWFPTLLKDDRPVRGIFVDPFYLDRQEVTNRDFSMFVEATGRAAPYYWPRGELPPDKVDHPLVNVNWGDAAAYCRWAGKRLPTEAEWEAAARGKEGRTYPWGEEPPTPAHAVFGRESGQTDPVGSHPKGATPEGVFDLVGNEAEWTSSLFKPYPYSAKDGRENPMAQGERVTRGGDHVFDVSPEKLTGVFRDGFSRNPGRGHRHIDFRCAKDAR